MIAVLVNPSYNFTPKIVTEEHDTWLSLIFGFKKKKVQVLKYHPEKVNGQIIIKSDTVSIGDKFDLIDNGIVYFGIKPFSKHENNIYRCTVDSILDKRKT
jgi:hypothetical protein